MNSPSTRALASTTIALAAFLLFTLEPMVGKVGLPWFGGSADVWTACLAFFQVALFLGYLYARWLSARPREWQVRIHIALVVLSVLWLPVLPGARWKPSGHGSPLLAIVEMLGATIGLPFVLLSSTGPLVQSWLAAMSRDRKIYRLFALSNLASFVGLLSYPIFIEPRLPLSAQNWAWSGLYIGFVLAACATAWTSRRLVGNATRSNIGESVRIGDTMFWFALSAVPSALLVAVTEYMLRDIAAIPLLWMVPLAVYLVTLTLAFAWRAWFFRPVWYALFLGAVYAILRPIASEHLFENYRSLLALDAGAFFVCCLLCHAELAAARPDERQLTTFYMVTAAGGAAGGLLVVAVAPAILNTAAYDVPTLLALATGVAAIALWRRLRRLRSALWKLLAGAAYVAGAAFVAFSYLSRLDSDDTRRIAAVRNFYGALRVVESTDDDPDVRTRQLLNGNIMHGEEFTARDRRDEPVTYYTVDSGVGVALRLLGQNGPIRAGFIGLGAGTLAAYGRPGDVYRFYELNPAIAEIAQQDFWYLQDCDAAWTIVLGDARLSLEREAPEQFDVLAIDAFISDAIPTHLLTTEAFATYRRHLKPDGVLAVHVTNRYIDLAPVVAAAAASWPAPAKMLSVGDDPDLDGNSSDWILITARPDFFSRPELDLADDLPAPIPHAWTDDYSSVWRQLK